MKKVYFAAMAFAALALTSCGNTEVETTENPEVVEAQEVTYTVDTEATTLEWKGTHMKGDVEDHSHKGTVAVSDGMIAMKGEDFVKGEFKVDLTSLKVTEMFVGSGTEPDPKTLQSFVDDLNSINFLNVSEYATAKIVVNSVTANSMNVTLNVVGQEKTLDIPVTTNTSGDKLMAEGKFTVDMFGIFPKVKKEGEEYTGSEVEFDLNLVMNK